MDNLECPSCGSHDLDDGSFDYESPQGRKTYKPMSPVHYECMSCDWTGSEPNNVGDRQAMLEDKADGEHEERMLARYQDDC